MTVVEDVSFDIGPGEVVGVVGESGCGKTVTAMSILGLLPGDGDIQAGRILFEGRDLAALPESELRSVRGREIALISQEPMVSLNPAYRVGWQLAQSLRQHHGVSRSAARSGAVELLRSVHLPEPEAVARRYPHELSGGMAQRVAIARALAGEPKLLIADEPTTALDVTVQAEILDLLREIQQARQMSILLVTHDWGVVADLCERVVVMYAGQVVERAVARSDLPRAVASIHGGSVCLKSAPRRRDRTVEDDTRRRAEARGVAAWLPLPTALPLRNHGLLEERHDPTRAAGRWA